MNENLRQKKVASLIKDTLSALILSHVQDSPSGLLSITRVDMSKDLRTARIYLSVYGNQDPENILQRLKNKQGILRKAVASRTKLKYNPKLIFSLDPSTGHEKRLDEILKTIANDER
jgi:ribosome-binding factor A